MFRTLLARLYRSSRRERVDGRSGPRRRSRFRPQLEALEDRWCPAGLWSWIGPVGGDGLWSNPNGVDWKDPNGNVAGKNQYPGLVAGDGAGFYNLNAGTATLDVQLPNNLAALHFEGWGGTLTLNNTLKVTGNTGNFTLDDGTTINIGANKQLILVDLGGSNVSFWEEGTISGASGASFVVSGTTLTVTAGAGLFGPDHTLSTQMTIMKSSATQVVGAVQLLGMRDNLLLNGTFNNYIDVLNGGQLLLKQHIAAAGQANMRGGIDVGAGHTGNPAVWVESGGEMDREDFPAAGVLDQVEIAGAVYNSDGIVQVLNGSLLNLTKSDAFGYSYWQKLSTNPSLKIDNGSNINAAGTYQINAGLVQFRGSGDELDGAGLVFGNFQATTLAIADMGTTTGKVTIQGPVTMAAQTTTNLNYNGGTNQADLLDVKNGVLTLAGTLKLFSLDGNKPTVPLVFLDDSGPGAAINGAFATINGSLPPPVTYTGQVVNVNATLVNYQVTIK
jgi:hypothetical protein